MPQRKPLKTRKRATRRGEKLHRISVPLSWDELQRLRAVAQSQKVPVSVAWVGRLAVRQLLERTQAGDQLAFDFGGVGRAEDER